MPGIIKDWRSKTTETGLDITEVETIEDEKQGREQRNHLKKNIPTYQSIFGRFSRTVNFI